MAAGLRSVPIATTIAALDFLPDRTPETTDADAAAAFARLCDYRDGAVFVGHWAGTSEWERHAVGDEIVIVLDGATTLFALIDGHEQPTALAAGEMVVVPQGTWHRFETPDRVQVMSVTPQPTEHRADRPT